MQRLQEVAAIVLCVSSTAFAEDNFLKTVRTTELNRSTIVVGNLGFALGTVLEVEGRWSVPDDESKDIRKSLNRVLSVSTVNGKLLDQNIVIPERFITFVFPVTRSVIDNRSSVRYRVFEGLVCAGYPKDAFMGESPIQETLPFGVYGTLTIFSVMGNDQK
jgi:hypothetical protein